MKIHQNHKNFRIYFSHVFWQQNEEFRGVKDMVPHGYNDIGLYDTWHITSDILWYQLFPHWLVYQLLKLYTSVRTTLICNDTKYPFMTLKINSPVFYAVIQPNSARCDIKTHYGFWRNVCLLQRP
jgi:hypothetical protein